MASETHQENGVLNGEPATRTPATAIDPEPHSPALDTAEHTDKGSQGPAPGMQEQSPVSLPETQQRRDLASLPDSDNPEASNTDDAGASPGAQPTPQQGTRENTPPSNATQEERETEHKLELRDAQEQKKDEKVTDKTNAEKSSDADEGSTHLKQDNTEPTPESDVAELSEGTKAQEPEEDKLNHPFSDKQKDGAGERPVRQKLKETSIAGVPRPNSPKDHAMASQVASVAGADSVSDTSSAEGRGRLRRKRSRGDMNEDEKHDDTSGVPNPDETGHRRKRSRDSKTDDESSDNQGRSKSKLTAGDKQDISNNMDTKPLPNEGGIRTPIAELKSTERDAPNRILSPKKKRSRDQFDKDLKSDALDEKDQEGSASAKVGEPSDRSKAMSGNRTVEGEPEKKRHRDDSQDRSSQGDSDLVSKKASAPNPFSNTLGVSPFASMSSKPTQLTSKGKTEKKEQPMTSASAFASSKLASFASSDKSPFSSLGGGSSTGLKSASPAENTTGNKPLQPSSSAFAASPFAAAATSSPFGALGGTRSAFSRSGFGTGFSAATPKLGGGLAGFAASTTGSSAILGATSSKHGDDKKIEAGKGGDDAKSTFEGLEEEKGDERFHEQQTETGEEGEDTIFSCRGKLFHFDGKEWKERGVGVFKVNVREPANGDDDKADESSEEQQPREGKAEEKKEEEEEVKAKTDEDDSEEPKKKTARVIMRADGVWRVILNIPIFKGMKAGDPSGAAPKGKQVHFAGFEEGKSVPFLFRTGNEDVAKELCATIGKLQESL
ncbi:hypothetical protein GX51_06674 [Blastomyces parvus]|uniref:RanBD1 domain-containing protein n=1 Tax=Blastomyces parvus TaxID=2060905 RepID=A0A2B7WQ29_9EURO|nr:hypothetical protein GX51_06674 [Blastomyces parvus]